MIARIFFLVRATGAMYRDGKLEGASLGFKRKSLVEYVEFEMLTRYSGIAIE